ncbi:hypothetical protein FIT61_02620 [Candidatus Methylopumilus rimovensis]|uniref:Uncharacterized protein n=1 Tax=Candidatus Methylopumilus rimovensis TaxID=2588535 RepID=A0AAE6FSI7_9PROT|nr:hypothetical protein [Candidatus Methylopumilus rimovensis]QDD13355.1 hypothetical protein FIT61_02620 [Candidatus Methylopumilus rimovensis]
MLKNINSAAMRNQLLNFKLFILSFKLFILSFNSVLGLNKIFYPLLIINLLTNLNVKFSKAKFISGLAFISIAIISMLLRQASIDLTISAMRYFYGILLTCSFFYLNKNAKLTNSYIFIFTIFVIYEYFSISNNIDPYYFSFYDQNNVNFLGKTKFGEDGFRALGPGLNSTSSSCIALLFIFIFLDKAINLIKKKNVLTLLLAIFCLIMTFSLTAFIILLVLITLKLFSNFRTSLIFLLIFFLIYFLFSHHLNNRIDLDYLYTNFIIKKDLFLNYFRYESWVDLLFGQDLGNFSAKSIGGDFANLSGIKLFGIFFIFFNFYLIWICYDQNRKYLILAIIASTHYGIIYSIFGQIFFAALISNAFNFNKTRF